MINKPPIDDLAEKTGSKYSLCVVASKRARQILDSSKNLSQYDLSGKNKPLSIAAQEIYDGKVTVTKY